MIWATFKKKSRYWFQFGMVEFEVNCARGRTRFFERYHFQPLNYLKREKFLNRVLIPNSDSRHLWLKWWKYQEEIFVDFFEYDFHDDAELFHWEKMLAATRLTGAGSFNMNPWMAAAPIWETIIVRPDKNCVSSQLCGTRTAAGSSAYQGRNSRLVKLHMTRRLEASCFRRLLVFGESFP